MLMAAAQMCGIETGMAQETRLPAFPGAEGYAQNVTGGRGGTVYYVTRNDDCSDSDLVPGTLRWALRTGDDTPRTIVFATSGTIYLTSKLKFAHPNVSILGQSAPGGGITISGFNVYICKDNVIVRHVRFRAGDIPNQALTGLDVENCKHVILDHCSMTWSMEECLTMYDTDSTTVQWCVIGEGLYNSKHGKGARAYAMQWGGEHATMHHTLITNSVNRTPRFNGVRDEAALSEGKHNHDAMVDNEFANNVIFNWGKKNAVYGGENDTTRNIVDGKHMGYNRVYMIGNFFRPGPITKSKVSSDRYFVQGSSSKGYGQWYLKDNKFEVDGVYKPSGSYWTAANLALVNDDNLYGYAEGKGLRAFNLDGVTANQKSYDTYVLEQLPYPLSGLSYQSADEAFASVTSGAGASLPRYDEVDQRLLDEAAGRREVVFGASFGAKSGVIDSPDDITLSAHDTYKVDGVEYANMPCMFVEGKDLYASDADADGMPDLYEKEVGLNPDDASDGSQISASGYTNLEDYLNGIADGKIDKCRYEWSAQYIAPGEKVDIEQGLAEGSVIIDRQSKAASSTYDIMGRKVELDAIRSGQLFIRDGKIISR